MVAATLSAGESTAELVLAILGLCTAILVISSPIPTFKAIRTTHDVGATNPYSYLSVLLNSAIWVVFGIPALNHLVHPGHGHRRVLADWLGIPLMAANCYGVVAELVYVAIFIRFAVGRRCKPVIVLVGVVVFSVFVLILLLATHWPRTFVGHIAMYTGVAMYGIPVYGTYLAYKANDVTQISVLQASASFINGAVWTAYACIGHAERRAAEQEQAEAAERRAAEQEQAEAAERRAAELKREPAEAAEYRGLAAQDLESGGGGGGDVELALQVAVATGGAQGSRAGAGAQEQVLPADETEVLVQDLEAGGVEAALGMGGAGAQGQALPADEVLVLLAGVNDVENQALAAGNDNGALAAGEDEGNNNNNSDEHGDVDVDGDDNNNNDGA